MRSQTLPILATFAAFAMSPLMAAEIVHDAEYYVLEAQHGERWAAQDAEISARLKALRDKHGAPPNIIHVKTPW